MSVKGVRLRRAHQEVNGFNPEFNFTVQSSAGQKNAGAPGSAGLGQWSQVARALDLIKL
jgi:hypothetical protein